MSAAPSHTPADEATAGGAPAVGAAPGQAAPSPAAAIAGEWRFPGFVAGGAAVALPRELFVELLPRIDDEGELRATLYALAAAARPGPLPGVRHAQLLTERPLLTQFERLAPGEAAATVEAALARAAERGSLLVVELADGDRLYLAHTEAGRRQRERLLAGSLAPPPAPPGWRSGTGEPTGSPRAAMAAASAGPTGAAAAYEREIGMLTPAVAEALAEAEKRYPAPWIEEALREAALHNARSWAYAEAVLRRWRAEGRSDLDVAPSTGPARIGEEGRDASTGRDPGHDPYQRVVRRSWP